MMDYDREIGEELEPVLSLPSIMQVASEVEEGGSLLTARDTESPVIGMPFSIAY